MSTAAYGTWESPISVEQLTSASVGLSAPTIDGDTLYWLESHADQGGRTSLWRRPLVGGEHTEVTPAPANVRTRVHEYGGGEYAVSGGVVVYSDFADNRLYRVDADGTVPLTPAGGLRYADLRVHADRGLVLAVREDHSGPGECVNTLVSLPLHGAGGHPGTVLCSGADFYSTPELSPDGRLAWVQWDHPAMPWDATALHVGRLDDDTVTDVQQVAGGAEESAVQPRWLPDGRLGYVSDSSDYWNLYAWDGTASTALHPSTDEFAGPQWQLGQSPYAVVDADRLLCVRDLGGGEEQVGLLALADGHWDAVTEVGVGAGTVTVGTGTAAAVLAHRDRPATLATLDLATRAWTEVVSSSRQVLDPDSVSLAEAVSWSSEQGEVHGWFYPPRHAEITGPDEARPPLIVLSHGGPTACATPSLTVGYQFWTTRGFAILDVNYGGSTGYGRPYRNRLRGTWGLTDVRDCAAGARAMVDQGRADGGQLVVKGGSAGGYTTLRALTSTRVFTAGISQYGVGDLEALATDTHKFESRYLDGLIGPYPQDKAVYDDRSPIHHVDELAAPILLLQGLDDKVVPPNQAQEMADAARRNHLPVALLLFAGEGHGFRRAETIKASLEAQLYFLGRIFGFTPAGELPPIDIENLPT